MSKLLRDVSTTDIRTVATNMRTADINECFAAAGSPHELALFLSVTSSIESKTLVSPRTNEPVGICGISKGNGDGDRRVWLLGTDGLTDNPITLCKHARPWLDAWASKFILWNWADERNEAHIRWLKFMGASFNGSTVSPYTGTRLLHFTKVSLCA